ncbi:hypothetical protein FGO68_gene1005 [Halteria grandinella]|uniref:ABC3 transporter permease C-terminal domain-containing protein n=1 Tax=Halteria grandinella TaxID=5974 RepID=A0A8J8P313_HALGN|nr:hypothetical protein FGO68_gene1005 [Halteria grandinella]
MIHLLDSTLENVELGFDEDQSQIQRKFNNINQTMEESFEKSYKPGQSFADDSYSNFLDKDDDSSNDHRADARKSLKDPEEQKKLRSMKCWPATLFFTTYQWRDLKRRKCHFSLAFCSVFFIVVSTLVVTTVIDKGPYIFLELAQDSFGEIDAIITPGVSESKQSFLSYTAVENRIKDLPEMQYRVSPRKVLQAVSAYGNNTNQESGLTSQLKVDGLTLYLIDTLKERSIELGKNYDYQPLQQGECIIHQNLATNFLGGIGIEQKITLQVDIQNLYNALIDFFNVPRTAKQQLKKPTLYTQTNLTCIIKNLSSASHGKFEEETSLRSVIMEISPFNSLLSSNLPKEIMTQKDGAEFAHFLAGTQSYDFSDQLVMTMPEPRITVYEQASYDDIQKSVLTQVNNFIDDFGFHAVTALTPVLGEMQKYNLAILFFNLIFRIVIMIFIVISVMLIYSLLMIGIETKTMETGIMRMVGVSKRGLVQMIFVQSFMFVVPALIFGVALSFPALALCFIFVFTEKLEGAFAPIPSTYSIILAVSVGLLIPLFSSILPVIKVLGQNLNDAINYQRSRVKSTYVEILKANQVNIVPYLIFGCIATLYGFGVYYLLPLALLSFNLGLILQVFFFILLGYLFGLILFAINAQRMVENMLLFLTLFWEAPAMKALINNNLKSHTQKNKLTSTVFSMALGFLIFLMVQYRLLRQQNSVQRIDRYGSYPYIITPSPMYNLDYMKIEQALRANNDSIESHTWMAFEAARQPINPVDRVNLLDVSQVQDHVMRLYAIQPNAFEVLSKELQVVSYQASGLGYGESLYSARGSQSIILGTYFKALLDTDPSEGALDYFKLKLLRTKQSLLYRVRPTVLFDQVSVFKMGSKEPGSTTSSQYHVLSSLPIMAKYLSVRSVKDLAMERVILKMKDTATLDQSEKVVRDILAALPSDTTENLKVKKDKAQLFASVDRTISLLFTVLIMITMFLCFFQLSTSMSANLYEQTKEIGVLLSLGFTRMRIVMLYSYESFILVMASSMLGVLVGTIAAFTMVLQFTQFNDMPTNFYFPWQQLIGIFVASIVCALLSTIGPTRSIVKHKIASILRM